MTTDITDFCPSAFCIAILEKNIDGTWYFSGSVLELPDVEVFENSYEQAYTELINVITSLKLYADEQHRSFPKPQSWLKVN